MMELVIFACAIELQNAICPLSYHSTTDPHLTARFTSKVSGLSCGDALRRWDVNAIPHELRIGNACARGRMRLVLDAVFRDFAILNKNGKKLDPWTFVFLPTLARLIASLKNYMGKSLALGALLHDGDDTNDEDDNDDEDNIDEDDAGKPGYGEVHTQDDNSSLFSRNLDWIYLRWPNLEAMVHNNFGKDCYSAQNLIYPMVDFRVQELRKSKASARKRAFFDLASRSSR